MIQESDEDPNRTRPIGNTLTLTARADLMRQTGFSFVEINSHLYDFEVNEGH